MAPNGDAMIHEGQLREIVASLPGGDIAELLDGLLGTAWDNELEVFRYAGEVRPSAGYTRWAEPAAPQARHDNAPGTEVARARCVLGSRGARRCSRRS